MDRLPKKNLTAKIIALIMAIILWVYVMNEQNPPVETSLEIPLEVRNLAASSLAVDIPESVRIKVRGPRSLIVGLSQSDVKSYIDLKGLADGANSVKVHTAIPASMEIVEVSPEKINLRLDTISSRQIPVEIRSSGSAVNGAESKITQSVTHVTVEGPGELLSTATKLIGYVDLAGRSNDFTVNAPLKLVDDNEKVIEGLTVTPAQVSVSVAFTPIIQQKVVTIKPSLVGELAANLTVKQLIITPLQIEISGDPKVLEKIDTIDTEPISLTGIDKDTVIEVKLQPKDNIVLSKNMVTVNVSVVPNKI